MRQARALPRPATDSDSSRFATGPVFFGEDCASYAASQVIDQPPSTTSTWLVM
jgi:hypothetical protein